MKWLAAVLVVVVTLLQARLWLASDGVRELSRLEAAVATQRGENERLENRNKQLGAEVRDLKNGMAALEERARSELGMISANETFYQVVPRKAAAIPGETSPTPRTPPTRTAAR
jgi:cell division protein FtsB